MIVQKLDMHLTARQNSAVNEWQWVVPTSHLFQSRRRKQVNFLVLDEGEITLPLLVEALERVKLREYSALGRKA